MEPLTGTRQEGETTKAVIACNGYLRMGPGRSLAKLQRKYSKSKAESAPPTKNLQTLTKWSGLWGWVKRSEWYDATDEEKKDIRAKEAKETGLALEHERIIALKDLGDRLTKILDRGLFRTKEIKVGSGKDAKIIPIDFYNKDVIDNLRGILEDLAKETGGRVKKLDYSGDIAGDIKVRITDDE